jgi:hypothetical protein
MTTFREPCLFKIIIVGYLFAGMLGKRIAGTLERGSLADRYIYLFGYALGNRVRPSML